MPELVLKPNYPGLLFAAALALTGAALLLPVLLAIHTIIDSFSLSEWVIITFLVVLLITVQVVCVASFLDSLRVALTGIRGAWRVRMDSEGIHYPLLSAHPIPWHTIREVSVAHGYNGKDIWITLDPSLKLTGISVFNGFLGLIQRKKVNLVRIMSHKFKIDPEAVLQAMQDFSPDSLGIAYPEI